MSHKENLLCELNTEKGTWKIVVRITDIWRLNKHNGRQSIEMVLMDHMGTKIGATLWQELFPEFEPKLRCGGAYVIQNVKVVDTHSDYKVSAIKYLVYFVKTTSVKEVDRPEIPPNVHAITSFADIISGVAKPDTLVDVVGVIAEVIERKTVNPTYIVTVKLRDNSHAGIIMIVWEEYALQLDDAIEKNHFVQKPLVVMLTLAKIKEPKGHLRVPFYIGGLDDEGDVSQSQSTQYCQNKFLHNAQIVSFCEIKTLLRQNYSPAFGVLTAEFLNSLKTSGIPNHKLRIKVGTPIILLWNLDQADGLCNETRLIVTRLGSSVVEAEIITGPNIGHRTYIPRMNLSPSDSPWPFKLIRRQFPFMISFAMTINKSQGQSLTHVGLYLSTPVFSHGQLYVALSRVQSKKGLHILIHDNQGTPKNTTINVVYKEVFANL
ncbi:ATP-dependent DNA helicase PIF1 [Glycine soja]|uniref:ATP-dependent DNA helicase PIF1 n=1 Tax=Glycine soja TaxID=3848 RepID=A0A0B2QPW3_GLYSO|nr:ATP-dependent DNA helicase PIF1 [Glycine soja]